MKTIDHPIKNNSKISITVCMGSSCHLKGSYEIIEFLKEAIKQRGLENTIILKGSFCMEKCTEGVNVKINDELFSVVSVTELDHIFQRSV